MRRPALLSSLSDDTVKIPDPIHSLYNIGQIDCIIYIILVVFYEWVGLFLVAVHILNYTLKQIAWNFPGNL